MFKPGTSLSIALTVSVFLQTACFAWPSKFSLQTGSGDEITIKKGWFGSEKKVVKDRLGDGFEQSEGIFGNKSTKVGVLGNSYSKKKGIFGTKETEVTTIFGDSLKTKKGWFGRSTTVNASGITGLIDATIHNKLSSKLPALPGQNAPAPNKSIEAPMGSSLGQPVDTVPMQPGTGFAPMKPPMQPVGSSAPPAGGFINDAPAGLSSPPAQRLSRPAVDPVNDNNDVLKFVP